ncbi:universal stress protein [Novosphingobium sp. NDB2Meth1]|uniref:universal stress protein n=1 Tax=Novosphingobium sp. NDB2Meth1 TaxID=1892847 RepID=UPI000931D6ED|nr:universal stress protein [Novosphingobium sp. NDB2Meth1]
MVGITSEADGTPGAEARAKQRVYLVIMDDTEESARALRFAARRAVRTGGTVHILALVPRQEFVVFGSIQATIEGEARERAEDLARAAAGSLVDESGLEPAVAVRTGSGPQVVRDYLAEHPEVSALVLGAAAEGNPGPLVTHFTSQIGQLPCVLMIVPGGIDERGIDSFS